MKFFSLKILAICILIFTSCETNNESIDDSSESIPLSIIGEIESKIDYYEDQGPHEHHSSELITSNFDARRRTGFIEGFEQGSKRSYSRGNVDLPTSGRWVLSNAKIGTSSRDRKFGDQSTRIRGRGYAVMSFDIEGGVRTVRVRHAKYGNDSNASWRLVASYDNGDNWSFVGEAINTTSTSLSTVSFEVDETRNVRYGIYKDSGTFNRVNIDNVEILTNGDGNGDGDGDNGGNGRDSNLTFGNPSDANTDANNYLLRRTEYTLSFNNSKGTPNWVSWHLNEDWTGSRGRCNCFMQDPALPSSFYSPTENDYRGSGFQRGHLCPSADRDATDEENANTYFMTNMAPQTIGNNLGPWADFERYLRSLTRRGNEVHIIAGVAGTGGTGTRGYRETINNGKITVPDSFWKVALVLPNGSNDISRVSTSTRMIAVNMPNDQGISDDWRRFTTSVDQIEELTGYDFFENIPNTIESIIESRVDN